MDAPNNESKPDLHIPKEFFKQFKDKKQFQSFFNELFKTGVEQMLQVELDAHLGYDKHSKAGYNSGNSRNGSYRKTVKPNRSATWPYPFPGTAPVRLSRP